MNRRGFLTGIIAAPAAAKSVALQATEPVHISGPELGRQLQKVEPIEDPREILNRLSFMHYNIRYHGEEHFTAAGLYQALKLGWKEVPFLYLSGFPMIALTDSIFEMQNGWKISSSIFDNMVGGGITTVDGKEYTAIHCIGPCELSELYIEYPGAPRQRIFLKQFMVPVNTKISVREWNSYEQRDEIKYPLKSTGFTDLRPEKIYLPIS